MKKAIGIGIALCIMMSLVVILAGAGEGGKAKDVVVQWKGTGTNVTHEVPPEHLVGLVSKCNAEHIFKVDMFDPTTGKLIGTGYDCITDLGDHVNVTTCYIFDFSNSGHGHGAIISKNNVTLQPAFKGCESLTHILGSFPDGDTILNGTGKYENVEGRVRVSGGANLTHFASGTIEFDHLFVITLDKGESE